MLDTKHSADGESKQLELPLIFGLPSAVTYSLCMQWVDLGDFARLEIAMCSTSILSSYISSAGPLHSVRSISGSSTRSEQFIEWAVKRSISVVSADLTSLAPPFADFDPFLQHCGGRLLALELKLAVHTVTTVGESIAQHCPDLQRLKLRNCNLDRSLNSIFNSCALQDMSLTQCVGVIDLDTAHCPTLQSLTFQVRCKLFARSAFNRDSPSSVTTHMPFPSLQVLHIGFVLPTASDHTIPLLVAGGKVTSLSLHKAFCSRQVLLAVAEKTPDLQQLSLDGYNHNYLNDLTAAMPRWRRLTEFTQYGPDRQVFPLFPAAAAGAAHCTIRSVRIVDGTKAQDAMVATVNYPAQTLTLSAAGEFTPKRLQSLTLPPAWVIEELYLDLRCATISTSRSLVHQGVPRWNLQVLQVGRFVAEIDAETVTSLMQACAPGCQLQLQGPVSAAVKAQFPSVAFV
jgi:hypothetical protein